MCSIGKNGLSLQLVSAPWVTFIEFPFPSQIMYALVGLNQALILPFHPGVLPVYPRRETDLY